MKRALACAVGAGTLVLALALAGQADAQTPKRGGTLTIANFSPPPTLDCHGLGSAAAIVEYAPAFSTLLRFDPDEYPKIVGDLAASWTISPDQLTYTFKLVPDVHFHDGSVLTSADIKATYDRIKTPPQGVPSLRQIQLAKVAAIETPDPLTVVFKLSKQEPPFLLTLASPFNCIYSAKKLAEDPRAPEKAMMGTGPFKFVEYVPGSHISFARFDNYFHKGLPYLDGIKQFFLPGQAFINAVAGGQVDGSVTQMTYTARDTIRATRGDKTYFPETTYNVTNMVNINNTRKPLDDVRVRRALSLALDRRGGDLMMQKVANSKGWGAFFAAGVALDFTQDELEKLPQFSPDVAANRAEARKLLAEAGVKDLKLTLLSRNIGEPYSSLCVFVIDGLRQIGVNVEISNLDTASYFSGMAALNFDLAIDANGTVSSDPSDVLLKYLPGANQNYTGVNDPVLQDLYDKQAFETDFNKRREYVLAFQRRMLDQMYLIPMFRSINMGAWDTRVKGWKILPSPSLNVDMRQVWIDQ